MTFHMHSTFSDGQHSPEDMIARAHALGWDRVGLSDHAPYDPITGNMPRRRLDEYWGTLESLRTRWSGQITIYKGLEIEWLEPGFDEVVSPAHGDLPALSSAQLAADPRLDYWIGSMHFFIQDNEPWTIDGPVDDVRRTLRELFHGRGRAFAERYFRGLERLVRETRPPILGHLDLLKKHDPVLRFLDQDETWYQALVDRVLDAAEETGTVVEVNTGGMARGYQREPYPSPTILRRMASRGMPIQLNSDSHAVETLDFAYAETRSLLRDLGFQSQRVPGVSGWEDVAL